MAQSEAHKTSHAQIEHLTKMSHVTSYQMTTNFFFFFSKKPVSVCWPIITACVHMLANQLPLPAF